MRLVPLAEIRTRFLAEIEPVATATMATSKAAGLVLAADVTASGHMPHDAIALQRGFAVASRQTSGASAYLPASLAKCPRLVEAGDSLPAGADTIADPDDIRALGATAEILAAIPPGRHVRLAGGDVPSGRTLAAAGTRLTPLQAAVLRAAGCLDIPVRVPAVAIIAPPGSTASAALVMGLASRDGADTSLGYVAEARLAAALRSAESADLVLLAGWTGAGLAAVIAALAAEGMIVGRDLAVTPGAGTTCGFVRAMSGARVPVICLPGRLEDTVAAWLTLVRPCLDRLAGFAGVRPSASLPLARKIASAPGWADLAIVKRDEERWKPLGVGDISWSALAEADAWLLIGAESEGFATGDLVEAEFL